MGGNTETDATLLEKIRITAYYLWEARGGGNGYDKADWYAAETLLSLPPAIRSKIYPPPYSYVSKETILSCLIISHANINDFFLPSNTWIEIWTDPQTIFEYDRNRKLHFDEGFLCACYRIFKDQSVCSIAYNDHFPYKDLCKYRDKISTFKDIYRQGIYVPPPLFYYSDSYQLEILDGVHRSIALYDLAVSNDHKKKRYAQSGTKIWIGFDHLRMSVDIVAYQLWINYAGRILGTKNNNMKGGHNNNADQE